MPLKKFCPLQSLTDLFCNKWSKSWGELFIRQPRQFYLQLLAVLQQHNSSHQSNLIFRFLWLSLSPIFICQTCSCNTHQFRIQLSLYQKFTMNQINISSLSFTVKFGILAFQLVSQQRIGIHNDFVLLDFEYDKARNWLGCQSTECSSHRPWIDKINTIMGAELKFMSMSCDQYFDSQLNCLIFQSLFIPPWNDLMAMDYTDFQSCNFDYFFFRKIFKAIIFEIPFNHMEIARERFSPVINLSTTHIASTDYCVNFVGSNHFSIFGWYFGRSMGNMEITEEEHKNTHLFFFSHFCLYCLINYQRYCNLYALYILNQQRLPRILEDEMIGLEFFAGKCIFSAYCHRNLQIKNSTSQQAKIFVYFLSRFQIIAYNMYDHYFTHFISNFLQTQFFPKLISKHCSGQKPSKDFMIFNIRLNQIHCQYLINYFLYFYDLQCSLKTKGIIKMDQQKYQRIYIVPKNYNTGIQMKNSEKGDSKKKQKSTLAKPISTGTLFKKQDIKKCSNPKKQEITSSTKRQEMKSPAYHSFNISNSKTNSSNSTAAHSSKFIQQSLRTSPKSSLAQINSNHFKKPLLEPFKLKLKLQLNKTPSKIDDISIKKVKEEVKKSLTNVIKVYYPEKKSYLDVSMTQITSDGQVKDQKITKTDFNFLTVIGEGGYGKVWKVEHYKTRTIYAMKQMSKALIIMKKSAENVLNQMKILSKLKSPFIANMAFAFNDRDNLYLGMDYLPGGDVRTYLSESDKLREQQAKFIIACIIKAVEYIHANKIFHRDIKPENLVIDQVGYVRLTDFGIARSQKQKQCLDASGTPGYMAPQVLCKQVHSFSVDFYAIGIIAYQLMIGKRPYSGHNRAQIREAILAKQHTLKKKDIPSSWSIQSADFINKLIQRQPNSRLGSKQGVQQLMQHPWFLKYSWKQLQEKKLPSPFKAKYRGPNATDRGQDYDEAVNQYKLLQRTDQKVDIFGGYFFNMR